MAKIWKMRKDFGLRVRRPPDFITVCNGPDPDARLIYVNCQLKKNDTFCHTSPSTTFRILKWIRLVKMKFKAMQNKQQDQNTFTLVSLQL